MNIADKVGRLVGKGWSNSAIADKLELNVSSVIAYKAKYTMSLNRQSTAAAQSEYSVKKLNKVFSTKEAADEWGLTPMGALYNIKKMMVAGEIHNVGFGRYSTEKSTAGREASTSVVKTTKKQELPFGSFEITNPNTKLYLSENELRITW
jgi:hypothetical protein